MYHNTLGRCSSRSLEPESSYDQASSHPTSTRRIVPEHWAVGTAEEHDRQFFIVKYLMVWANPSGGDHEDKPYKVKVGNREAASSTISI